MTPAKRKRDSIIPEKNDVLLGRGGINSKNTGNDLLHRLALEATEQYRTAKKKQKYDFIVILFENTLKIRFYRYFIFLNRYSVGEILSITLRAVRSRS